MQNKNYLNQLEGFNLSEKEKLEAAEGLKVSEEIINTIVEKLALLFGIEFSEHGCLDNPAIVSTSVMGVCAHYLTALYATFAETESEQEIRDFSTALYTLVFNYISASLISKISN